MEFELQQAFRCFILPCFAAEKADNVRREYAIAGLIGKNSVDFTHTRQPGWLSYKLSDYDENDTMQL